MHAWLARVTHFFLEHELLTCLCVLMWGIWSRDEAATAMTACPVASRPAVGCNGPRSSPPPQLRTVEEESGGAARGAGGGVRDARCPTGALEEHFRDGGGGRLRVEAVQSSVFCGYRNGMSRSCREEGCQEEAQGKEAERKRRKNRTTEQGRYEIAQ